MKKNKIGVDCLKKLCPVRIETLCSLLRKSQKDVCENWLKYYLKNFDFKFVNGTLYYIGE